MREIKITAVKSIWVKTFGSAIGFCYVIAFNSSGYMIGLLSWDQCVVRGTVHSTEIEAEGALKKIVRETTGALYQTNGPLYTVLQSAALSAPWKAYED